MKRIFLFIILMVLLSTSACFASTTNIIINNQPVYFTEQTGQPFIENNYTLVPMRIVMEQYGCTISWSQSLQTVTITKGNSEVKVPIGQNYILVNNQAQPIEVPAQVINGKTYLPIRAILEGVGAKVEWNQENNSVIVKGENNNNVKATDNINTNIVPIVKDNNVVNNLINVNEKSYNDFLNHFDIEISTDVINGVYSNTITKDLSIIFKDSNDKNDLITFLKSIDYTTLQNYTLKLAQQNCSDSAYINLTYITSGRTVKDVAFNAININIKNQQIQNINSISWGDTFIKN